LELICVTQGTIDEFGGEKKNRKIRNIRTCCDQNEYENGYQPRSNIKDGVGDLLQIPTVSVNRWTNHLCQWSNGDWVVKQTLVHTAEWLPAETNVCEVKTAIANMKRHKFQGSDKI